MVARVAGKGGICARFRAHHHTSAGVHTVRHTRRARTG
jgi:hypothetical protein